MTHKAKFKLVILLLGVALAIPMGCSEKVVNDPAPDFGEANLVIDIQRAPEDPERLIGVYRLTVTAPDMDTVIADMQVIDGQYVVGTVQVPIGDRRRFVLEFVQGPETASPIVFYRGEAVANVRPGGVLTLDIVLRPVAPIAKLWPGHVDVSPGGDFSLDLNLYNLPAISEFAISLRWDDDFVRVSEITPDPALGEDILFMEVHPNKSNSPVVLTVADTTGASIVNARGNASLAKLDFTSQVVAGASPVYFTIEVLAAQALGIESDTLISGRDFFVENARVAFTPIPDVEVVFPDLALERYIRSTAEPSLIGPIMLSDIIHLTYVGIASLGVTDLTGIEYLANLRDLNISNDSVGNAGLEHLSGLTRLQWLSCENCWIDDLSPLTGLTTLSSLDIDANPVGDISALAGLSRMTYLSANNTQLTDISPLAGFPELIYAYLAGNQISDLSPLLELTNLYWLDLGSNLISDISPLVNLDAVRYMYLYSNQISNLSALQDLSSIYRLELHDNLITDIGPLVANEAGIGDGDVITIFDNPVAVSEDPIQLGHFGTLANRGVNLIFGY